MIRAVIFDCFGVLTTEGWQAFKRQHFKPDSERGRKAYALRAQVDAGLIGYGEFAERIAALTGVTTADLRRAIERNVPNETLFAYIRNQLKLRFKIGLLSNTARDRLLELFGDERLQLFDDIALSFVTGIVKPQPEAFQGAADRLGVVPEECIFVDDQERYVAAARAQGMHTVLFRDTESCVQEIERIAA